MEFISLFDAMDRDGDFMYETELKVNNEVFDGIAFDSSDDLDETGNAPKGAFISISSHLEDFDPDDVMENPRNYQIGISTQEDVDDPDNSFKSVGRLVLCKAGAVAEVKSKARRIKR